MVGGAQARSLGEEADHPVLRRHRRRTFQLDRLRQGDGARALHRPMGRRAHWIDRARYRSQWPGGFGDCEPRDPGSVLDEVAHQRGDQLEPARGRIDDPRGRTGDAALAAQAARSKRANDPQQLSHDEAHQRAEDRPAQAGAGLRAPSPRHRRHLGQTRCRRSLQASRRGHRGVRQRQQGAPPTTRCGDVAESLPSHA